MNAGEAEGWSSPDAEGICTQSHDVGAKATLRGRRSRRSFTLNLESCAAWPAEWRDLARDWLGGKGRLKWQTAQKLAGTRRAAQAPELLQALLAAGWISVEETREQGRWVPRWLQFQAFEMLRERLSLPNRETLAARHAELSTQGFDDTELDFAAATLAALPPTLALRRHGWLDTLQRWTAERRSGTRRDFALLAGGDTKSITAADWDWLAANIDLGSRGIEAHTPLLLRAPLTLRIAIDGGEDALLPLAALPDFAALTPASLRQVCGVQGSIGHWRLVENRTSFERAARQYGARDAVVWLPGYPPGWWRQAMARLLHHHPAPALIACDPDPSGIEIASVAGKLWQEQSLDWQPWGMDPQSLRSLPQTRPLSELDRLLAGAPAVAGLAAGAATAGHGDGAAGLEGRTGGLAAVAACRAG